MKKQKKLPILKYAEGGKLSDAQLKAIIGNNSNLDFVNRMFNPEFNIKLPESEGGGTATHYMMSADNMVFPSVVNLNGKLKYLAPEEAYNHALQTKQFIKLSSPEEADDFARNYKRVTPLGQMAYGGFIPTNDTETKYYPFGGLINQGVTTIASALGANDKTAQLIGSGVATATGLIPGMQDNFLQAGDLVGDIGNATGDKTLQTVGQTASALTPLAGMFMANGGELTEFEGNTHENGGVPLGNSNVEVEGGETKHENYIFSDRIKVPWKKLTFAAESERINKKYKDLTTDPLAQKSKKVEMDKLRDAQEVVKGEMMKKAQKMMGDAGMHQMPDGSMMKGQMAYGGKMYYSHGGTHIVDENYGINQFKLIPNEDNNYLGKEGWQYYNEGNVPPNSVSKDYTPEEQLLMDQYQTEYAKEMADPQLAGTALQRYQEKLAGLGNNEGFNASHINPAYRDQYNAQKNGVATPEDLASIANKMGQSGSNQAGNNGTGTGAFNDQLGWDEKLMPFLPVAGQALTLIGGPEKTQYQQAQANLVNLKPQRTAAEKQAAIARLMAGQNIRNVAGNSGRALTNMVTSNAAIQSNVSDQLAQSYMNEANANAQILNQTGMFNTQIQNQQTDANAMNKSKFQEQAIATLANLANTYTGVNKDQRAYKSQNAFNTMAAENLGTSNYGFYVDENGVVRTKFKVG